MVAAKQDHTERILQTNPETRNQPHSSNTEPHQIPLQPSKLPQISQPHFSHPLGPRLVHSSAYPVHSATLENAALRAATEAAAVALTHQQAVETREQSLQNHAAVPSTQALPTYSQQPNPTNSPPRSYPLQSAVLLNETDAQRSFHQKMDIHDATGTILHQLGVNGDPDSVQQSSQPPGSAPQSHQIPQPQQNAHNETPHGASQTGQVDTMRSQNQAQLNVQQSHEAQVSGPLHHTSKPVSHQQQAAVAGHAPSQRKTVRMPGTKQCPSCQNTIAAALAKCPKCPHVFREKKEKVKRSGKRGKKNCPKCNFENPSACSSCKNCKYVFRLKLMDKYKQMRPRPTSDSAAAAAAAAAHAAANMGGQHAGVTAVSTVPMPAGVASYPNSMAPPMHPTHATVSVIPPLTQHPMSIHPHAHNVHTTGVPQMHPLPQHSMQHHQPHPQL